MTRTTTTAPHGRWRGEAIRWLATLLLLTPLLALYLAHFFIPYPGPGVGTGQVNIPTGFLHIDMPAYAANARGHFEYGGFSFTYPNPANPTYGSPAIYWQPQTLFMGLLLGLTGWDIAAVMLIFGTLAALAMVRVGLALWEEVAGLQTLGQWLGAVLFTWGGGVLVISGLGLALLRGEDPLANWGQALFALDPENGWWFLNSGRNLVFPTETFYHALFYGSALLLMRRQWAWAVVVAAVLAASQPFTGIQWLLILFIWALIERFWWGSRAVPTWLCVAGLGLLVVHVGYYLAFLPFASVEHRELLQNWQIPWLYQADAFVPALILAAIPALWRFRTLRVAGETLSSQPNRLLVVWFLGIFITANHGFAITPLVELHFVRGYDWAALMLLGAPVLAGAIDWLAGVGRFSRPALVRASGALAVVALVAVFLSDNAAWMVFRPWHESTRVSQDQQQVFRYLSTEASVDDTIILSQDPYMGFLLIAYTPVHSWASQKFNTPGYPQRLAELEAFFERGVVLDKWRDLPVLILKFNDGRPLAALTGDVLLQNQTYQLIRPRVP